MALSSTEAKYRGTTVAACKAIWLKILLKDLGELVDTPIPVYCDNLSRIQLAKNPFSHAQPKHIEVYYHYIREWIVAGDIDLLHVGTNEQVADIFATAMGLDKLRTFLVALGL